jgi:hypothetical protein
MMMRTANLSLAAFLAFGLAACGESEPSVPTEAQQTADALTGDAKGAASDNPNCKLFTPAEVGALAGVTVGAGEHAAMGSGCQWPAPGGEHSVMLQIVTAEHHTPPSEAEGFKELPAIGEKGYVLPEMGGWHAGAVKGGNSINVLADGPGASEAKTVAFLQEALKRVPG